MQTTIEDRIAYAAHDIFYLDNTHESLGEAVQDAARELIDGLASTITVALENGWEEDYRNDVNDREVAYQALDAQSAKHQEIVQIVQDLSAR